MNIEESIKLVNEKLKNEKSKEICIRQIKKYAEIQKTFKFKNHNYNIGDEVFLSKGTLLHGTYKNYEGLQDIVKYGLISSWFINGRLSKYPSSVGVWNLKKNYKLKDYINFYSGGTILYSGIYECEIDTQKNHTDVISYSDLPNITDYIKKIDSHMWTLEETKEARFMPSLVQNRIQIGIIFNGESNEVKELLKHDILNDKLISDDEVKEFVNKDYFNRFIIDRKNKNDFFTDRESAIIYGIPSCFIEGILVGKKYENDSNILTKIKELLPNCYICNLDGIVIRK